MRYPYPWSAFCMFLWGVLIMIDDLPALDIAATCPTNMSHDWEFRRQYPCKPTYIFREFRRQYL